MLQFERDHLCWIICLTIEAKIFKSEVQYVYHITYNILQLKKEEQLEKFNQNRPML